jgi:hypothetical protein
MALKLQVGHAQGVNGKVGYTFMLHSVSVIAEAFVAVRGWHEEWRKERESETKGRFIPVECRPYTQLYS